MPMEESIACVSAASIATPTLYVSGNTRSIPVRESPPPAPVASHRVMGLLKRGSIWKDNAIDA